LGLEFFYLYRVYDMIIMMKEFCTISSPKERKNSGNELAFFMSLIIFILFSFLMFETICYQKAIDYSYLQTQTQKCRMMAAISTSWLCMYFICISFMYRLRRNGANA